MFRTYQVFLNRLLFVGDGAITMLALWIAWQIKFKSGLLSYGGHQTFQTYVPIMLFGLAAFWLANTMSGLYRPMRMRTLWSQVYAVAKATIFGMLLFMSALYFAKFVAFSREVLAIFAVLYVVLVLAERLVMRSTLRILRSRGLNQKFILLVGMNGAVGSFVEELEYHPWFGYRILGYVGETAQVAIPNLGSLQDLETILHQHLVDHVVIALSRTEMGDMTRITSICESLGVQSLILPDFLDILPAKPRFENFGDMPLIDTRYVPLDDAINAALKRAFDIVVSVLVLTILSPVYLVLAILIRFSSRGPIFFTQHRVGRNRRMFKMYKFRTMMAASEAAPGWTIADDPRKTRIGSVLRRYSLDELPQFWNVLIGDMSIIGPRPEQPEFVEEFRGQIPKYMVKHRVRPGITGWAQVNGWRGDTSIVERIRFDIDYIEHWSLGMDLRILLKTMHVGLIHPNAY